MDFAIGLVNSFFNLPAGQVMFYEEFEYQKNKTFLGLVEMTSGLVNASFSLPEGQAVKMIFFAPCDVWASKRGSCLLWVMSTEISVDIAVDSRSIVGRHSVETRPIVYPTFN